MKTSNFKAGAESPLVEFSVLMNDLSFGTRDKRGNWRPNEKLKAGLIPSNNFGAKTILLSIRNYVFGWNILFFAITVFYWIAVLPTISVMATLSWEWALKLLFVNAIGIITLYGFFEVVFYIKKKQVNRFKYNGNFPADKSSSTFLFSNQNIDNFLRSIFVTVPLGTAIEVLCLWVIASGLMPMSTFTDNPIWFCVLLLSVPLLHEVYFFFTHWAMHWPPIYKWVHSVHHNSINPSPWSSLSMHPIEGLIYFGTMLIQLLLFTNPFVIIYLWNHAAYGALVGHLGFDKFEINGDKNVNSHAYAHYLHHKHFDVNYSDDSILPLDKWFGTWHDGSAEGDQLMKERYQKKIKAINSN